MVLNEERAQIVEVCQRLVADRLVVGTAGNVSARVGDLLAITPSGLPYRHLRPDLVCVVRVDDGTHVEGPLEPASELGLHLAAVQATGARAVVHTHSSAATALACLGLTEVPPLHYYVALFGGAPRIAPYDRYGSAELAAHVAAALTDRNSALLAHHGAVSTGADLDEAYDRALTLEWLCDVWLRAAAAGPPGLLPEAEIRGVVAQLAGYGQRAPAPSHRLGGSPPAGR